MQTSLQQSNLEVKASPSHRSVKATGLQNQKVID